jgi:outer membrane protein assembly factor BamB
LWPSAAAHARDPKSVFHGLGTQPEEDLKPGQADPILLTPAWTYDGFTAPLAGDAVGSPMRLVAADRAGAVVALDVDAGLPVWRVPLQTPLAIGPALIEGVVYQATSGGILHALAVADGTEIWQAPTWGAAIAPPQLVAGNLIVVTDAPALIALDPSDGKEVGRLALPGRPLPPAADDTAIVIGTDHGMVLAVDPYTYSVRWRRYVRHAITAPPLLLESRVYVAAADHSLHCLRRSSGTIRWTQRTGSTVTAHMLALDPFLYVLCFDNDIYIVRLGNGHLTARVRMEHRLSQDAVVRGQHLYLAPYTEGTVIGLALPALGKAGRFALDARGEWFTTRPVVAGDQVAVGYGREAGRIVGLAVAAGKREDAGAAKKTAADKPPPAP